MKPRGSRNAAERRPRGSRQTAERRPHRGSRGSPRPSALLLGSAERGLRSGGPGCGAKDSGGLRVSRRPLLASQARLSEVDGYLQNVLSGRLPVNHRIIYQLQDVFNLLPNLNVQELVQAFAIKTNDMSLAIYLAAVMRAVVALHHLIDNKLTNKEKESAADKEKEEEKEKEKDEKPADEKPDDAKKGAK
mmetsp:Transcript_26963/g.85789  ORF Transcript_26963/g.85789 Transcript_26963/m.85789 type:complete len:190 (+) Transcript_26963:947-1516(+)